MVRLNTAPMFLWFEEVSEAFRTEKRKGKRRQLVLDCRKVLPSNKDIDRLAQVALAETAISGIWESMPGMLHIEFSNPVITDEEIDEMMCILTMLVTDSAELDEVEAQQERENDPLYVEA